MVPTMHVCRSDIEKTCCDSGRQRWCSHLHGQHTCILCKCIFRVVLPGRIWQLMHPPSCVVVSTALRYIIKHTALAPAVCPVAAALPRVLRTPLHATPGATTPQLDPAPVPRRAPVAAAAPSATFSRDKRLTTRIPGQTSAQCDLPLPG